MTSKLVPLNKRLQMSAQASPKQILKGLVVIVLTSLPLIAKGCGCSGQPDGRPLGVAPHGVSLDNPVVGDAFHQLPVFTNVRAWGTDSSVTVEFDVDPSQWKSNFTGSQLAFRFIAEDGTPLFTLGTIERFCLNKRLLEGSGSASQPEDPSWQVLEATGNRLMYPVQGEVMKDTVAVEVGFPRYRNDGS